MEPMKTVLLALCLVTSSVFAQPRTPALAQYMGQLDCTTLKAVNQVIAGTPRQDAIASAAEACVPAQFKPELRGLASSLRPATRAERIAALVSSANLRLTLCKDLNRVGDKCAAMFSPALDEATRDASQ